MLCGENADFFNVRAGGRYRKHWAQLSLGFQFVPLGFHTPTSRLEAALNYATPGEDQVECGVALSASGWNTFTMNNFASDLLPCA